MWDFIFFLAVFKEIPVAWWPKSVHEFSLDIVLFRLCFIFFCAFCHKFFMISNLLVMIIFNYIHNFRFRLDSFEDFKDEKIFDILNNMVVEVFQFFSAFKPFRFILLAEVAFPNPISSINFSFFFCLSLNCLFLSKV